MITSLDDFSRKLLYADFFEQETTWAHIKAAETLMHTYGIPLRYYVDSLRVFRFVQGRDSMWKKHILQTDESDPQWKQMMRVVGVDVSYALSPQAKGKIERPYRWLQDRIVRTCAIENLTTIEEVRAVLKEEVNRYNNHQVHSTTGEVPGIRFEKAKREGNSLFRPFALPKPYASAKDVFCLREKRMVNGYRKISLFNHEIEVPKAPLREEVEVHLIPDLVRDALEVRIWWDNQMVRSIVYPLKEFPRVHFSTFPYRSSFYYKPKARSPDLVKADADLLDRIELICLEFPRYGYRRVTQQLKHESWVVNHKKVLRLMRESDLLCRAKRKWVRTTDSRHPFLRYPNLLKGLIVSRLNEVWLADITYIRIRNGFVYLAAILDAFSRKVVGYCVSPHLDTTLTLRALRMAIIDRKPGQGVIHHSDQGVQYASKEYIEELRNHGIEISMARTGNPYENAMMESFFKTLKYEEVYLCEYETYKDVLTKLPYFMEEVYNHKRLHSGIGYRSPDDFEELVRLGLINQNQYVSCRTLLTSSVQS